MAANAKVDLDQMLWTERALSVRGTLEAMSGAYFSLSHLNRYMARTVHNPVRAAASWVAAWWYAKVAGRLERRAARLSRALGGL